ncbi:hypothetical protein AHiyo6_14170 [Arthrobacter sp. Hiyo6]|nr:hypothetical protein AHiyo6_14170 [Arthrobacter sp. Hiyo6]
MPVKVAVTGALYQPLALGSRSAFVYLTTGAVASMLKDWNAAPS